MVKVLHLISKKKPKKNMKKNDKFRNFLKNIEDRVYFIGADNKADRDSLIVNIDALKVRVDEQREILLRHIFSRNSYFHVKTMRQYKIVIDSLEKVIDHLKKLPEKILDASKDVLYRFFEREKKLVDRENNEKVEVIMENDLKKFYDYKKLLESDIAKKSIENTKIIVDIKKQRN